LYKTAAYNNAKHMQGQLRITLQSQVCPKNREAQNSVVGAPSNTAVSHVPS